MSTTGKMSDKDKINAGPQPQTQTNSRKPTVAAGRTVKSQTSKPTTISTASARSASSKTKSITVSKMTKLVLKPPTQPKIPRAGKVTIKKYITKPVTTTTTTTESRSTLVASETTFRVRSISKSAAHRQRHTVAQQPPNSSANVGTAENVIQVNGDKQKQADKSVTTVVQTRPVETPILQEITSTVVNCSTVNTDGDIELANKRSPRKCTEATENIQKSPVKSYDPIKARQFIRSQRQQRKDSAQADVNRSNADVSKEEIKKRLTALHKNSLQIVGKNVKRVRENSIDRGVATKTAPIEKKFKAEAQTKVTQKNTQSTPSIQSTAMNQPPVNQPLFLPVTPIKPVSSIKPGKSHIGLLRRAEELSSSPMTLSPFPFQAYMQSTLIEPGSKKNLEQYFPSPLVTPSVELSSKSKANVSGTRSVDNDHSNDMQLKAPESAKLKSAICRENETQTSLAQRTPEQSVRKSNADIPFWLRPSPVQMYPYNFIMAVRKKLEAITNPVSIPKGDRQRKQIELTTPSAASFASPVSRPNAQFISEFRQNLELKDPSESDKSLSDVEHQNRKSASVADKSDTGSNDMGSNHNGTASHRVSNLLIHSSEPEEYSMNFSPAYSSLKLKKDELEKQRKARDSQDTLSISSSILSQSSPEKRRQGKKVAGEHLRDAEVQQRQMSPLSTDHVNGLHIQSRNISQQSSAEQVRRSDTLNSNIESSVGRSVGQSNEKSEDVQKLLRDFNESLSMVIKVNKHLRRVLSTPPSRGSSSKVGSYSKQSTKYSDDFEQTSGTLGPSTVGEEIPPTEASFKQNVSSHHSVTGENESTMQSDGSRANTNIIESIVELSNHINTQISVQSSISNRIDTTTITNNLAISAQQTKTSSIHIQEELSQFSESPTNDLKSVSLSIAKKSITSDTEQHSNLVDSIQKHIVGEPDVLNQSIGSDIFEIFNKTGMLAAGKDVSWSEHNVSYASLGMCDRLLKSEIRKSDDLTSLLKLREKALIDRFKGQIAWLELQKQKHKEHGMTAEISAIKKKQRALLMRLQHDRQEIHRILKEKQQLMPHQQKSVNYDLSQLETNVSIRRSSLGAHEGNVSMQRAMKAIELNGGGSELEKMLQCRENELRRRRQHVEKLLNWHRRLDVEEREIIKMEEMVMLVSSTDAYQTTSHEHINDTLAITVRHHRKRTNCHNAEHSLHEPQALTNVTATTNTTNTTALNQQQAHVADKKHRQIQKIEDSLQTLKMISARSISSDGSHLHLDDDNVDIYGRQLNKLWKRLTGERGAKFVSEKVYQLSKDDLEQLYEEAKIVVLKRFHDEEFKRLLIDNSTSIIDETPANTEREVHRIENDLSTASAKPEQIEAIVPALSLESSTDELNGRTRNDVASDTDQGYYFDRSRLDEVSEGKATEIEAHRVPPLDASASNSIEDNAEQLETDSNAVCSEEIANSAEKSTTNENVNETSEKSVLTEDSLNRVTYNVTEIQTDEKQSDEVATEIPSAIESTPSKGKNKFRLNLLQNQTQLIEDTSFPCMDGVTMTVDSDISALSTNSESPMRETEIDDNRYQSDDFEEARSTDVQTSIDTITRATAQTSDMRSETPADQCSSPNELELRLISLDGGMKELSETISQSPVLSCGDCNSSGSDRSEEHEKPSDEMASNETNSIFTAVESEAIEVITSNGVSSQEESADNEAADIEQADPSPIVSVEDSVSSSIVAEPLAENGDKSILNEAAVNKRPFQYAMSSGAIDYNKVPEADALKRPQTPVEADQAKCTDQSTSIFPVLREIPNKPPPPYPVHRHLPKVTSLPTDAQIKQIVHQRIEELFTKPKELPQTPTVAVDDATFVKSPTPSFDASTDSPAVQSTDEQNVFERIIIDCCDEIMHDINTNVTANTNIAKRPLAFYNPPNRLRCLQEHALKRIYKLLNRSVSDDIMHQTELKPIDPRSCLPAHVAQLTFNNRRKRDAVDEILFQELYEEEMRWTNFDVEEEEIRNSVPDLNTLLTADMSDVQDDVSANLTATE